GRGRPGSLRLRLRPGWAARPPAAQLPPAGTAAPQSRRAWPLDPAQADRRALEPRRRRRPGPAADGRGLADPPGERRFGVPLGPEPGATLRTREGSDGRRGRYPVAIGAPDIAARSCRRSAL